MGRRGGVGGCRGSGAGVRIPQIKHSFFVCSLNSKDVYSGFGDQLSAMLNLAN